jgi:hypothetical protein
MALHLVGETLDKTRSHYLAETGRLIQLMRGIYVNVGDDLDATVLKHAVRIARYLYPHAYLSGASSTLLAPTRDGRLFLSARRKQRTRLRTLEIIQNEAPKHSSSTARTTIYGARISVRWRQLPGCTQAMPMPGWKTCCGESAASLYPGQSATTKRRKN